MKAYLTILFIFAAFALTAQAQTVNSSDGANTLSAAQLEAVKAIRTKAAREAAPLALKLASTVKQIYANMLADKPDGKLRKRLSRQMTENTGKIVLIKGETIREMVNLLTPEQKNLLKTEMKKPGAPADLSELMERVFNIPKE